MSEAANKATRHVRIAEDLAEMLGDVLDIVPTSSAKLLDPFIRPAITAAYERHRSAIERLKADRAAAHNAESLLVNSPEGE